MSTEAQIKTTVEEFLKVLATKNVIGEPIEIEDKTLIPVTKIGMGVGAGGGKGEKGESSGSGGGGGVDPVAIVVIFKGVPGPEGIKILPITTPSPIAKSIGEIVSTMMEKLREKKETKKEEK